MKPMSERIADLLERSELIPEGDRALYVYGLHELGVTLLNIATVVAIGALLGCVLESIVFLLAYVPLRRCAGGYHAKTETGCYFATTILITAALAAVVYIPANVVFYLLLQLAVSALAFAIVPVAAERKPLDKEETEIYRKESRILLFLLMGLSVFFGAFEFNSLLRTVSIAVLTLTLLLLLGLWHQKASGSQKTEQSDS